MNESYVVRIVAWITHPAVLHGIVIGVSLSLLIAVSWQFELTKAVITLLLVAAFLLLLGAVWGSRLLGRSLPKEGDRPREIRLGALLTRLLKDSQLEDGESRRTAITQTLQRGVVPAERQYQFLVSGAIRFFAMGRLFALLGIVVSFSVFMATYLQVERLTDQNALIRLQSLSAHQQISLDMRAEVTAVEALRTLAAELHFIYQQDRDRFGPLAEACGSATEDWRGAIRRIVNDRDQSDSPSLGCLRQMAKALKARSDNLESNRLLNQQVTGSSLRLTAYSRDLTEQFTSQFSAGCNTEPALTGETGRQWSALSALESGANELTAELDRDATDSVVYLSGPPHLQIVEQFESFLSLLRTSASSVSDLSVRLESVIEEIQKYLLAQEAACGERASNLRRTLDQLDLEFAAILTPSQE